MVNSEAECAVWRRLRSKHESSARAEALAAAAALLRNALLIDVERLVEESRVSCHQKFPELFLLELRASNPVQARAFDHSNPGTQSNAQRWSRSRNAEVLQETIHDERTVLLENGAHLRSNGDATAVDRLVDGSVLANV